MMHIIDYSQPLINTTWLYFIIKLWNIKCLTYLITFSLLMEHFQIAPVTAANRSLLSVLLSRLARGLSPPCSLTRSRVSSSSAHCTKSQTKGCQRSSHQAFSAGQWGSFIRILQRKLLLLYNSLHQSCREPRGISKILGHRLPVGACFFASPVEG